MKREAFRKPWQSFQFCCIRQSHPVEGQRMGHSAPEIANSSGFHRGGEYMNEAEARQLALKFVENMKLPVTGITTARRVRFDHAVKGRRDLWVICFARHASPGVGEYPGETIVEVDYDSGHTELFGAIRAGGENGNEPPL
jgi:hypothetical protein